jgi:hypothetical protein
MYFVGIFNKQTKTIHHLFCLGKTASSLGVKKMNGVEEFIRVFPV